MDSLNNLNILESILFSCGEPIEIERIAQVMELDEGVVISLADALSQGYEDRKAGFKLIKLDNKLQLCSRPEYFDYVRKILELKRNAPLSQACFCRYDLSRSLLSEHKPSSCCPNSFGRHLFRR